MTRSAIRTWKAGRRLRLMAVWLALPALAACGIPNQATPQALSRHDVPFGLLSPSVSNPPANPRAPQVATVVYLLRAGRLAGAARTVDFPLTVQRVLDALVQGPTNNEARSGLQSAINSGAQLIYTGQAGGTATVDLGGAFGQVGGQAQILAVAQVVFTVTSIPGVTGVLFTEAGQPVDAPSGDGTLTSGPLVRQDFATLAPP